MKYVDDIKVMLDDMIKNNICHFDVHMSNIGLVKYDNK